MKEKIDKQDKRSSGARKGVLAAVISIFTLAVLLTAYILIKDPIYYAQAKKKVAENDFSQALIYAEKCTDQKADALKEYISLRLEIIECYGDLLSEYNGETVKNWQVRAQRVSEQTDCDDEISGLAAELNDTLTYITEGVATYENMREDVIEMMDIFSEINRLYTRQEDGKNTAFTVEEEEILINRWNGLITRLSDYAATIRDAQKIYLLNYLIKEAQGELSDILDAMNKVVASGYEKTERVRFGGSAQKQFPDIQSSSGISVNFLKKEDYEAAMYDSIVRAYTECLSEYYIRR